jgi:hypothetical protein
MIWCISGLCDPKWLSNIFGNFDRQKLPRKKLIIVENGNGIGATKKLNKNIVIIKSTKGPGQYMNAALDYLKNNCRPNDWWCKFDSDDYYGPNYLINLKRAIKPNIHFLGKRTLYIKTTNNKLWKATSKSEYQFHGPTLAARLKDTIPFPLVNGWGEDGEWCQLMYSAGKKYKALPENDFLYCRYSDNEHAWPAKDNELRAMWQVEFDEMDEIDYDIINGIKPFCADRHYPVLDMTPENFMPFRILQEQNLKSIGYSEGIYDIKR